MNTNLIEDYMADLMTPVAKRAADPPPNLVIVPKNPPIPAEVTLAPAIPAVTTPAAMPTIAPVAAPSDARVVVAPKAAPIDPRIMAMLPPVIEGPIDNDNANKERRRRAADLVIRWLRFYMGDQPYAVEVLKVQEVLRIPDIMPLRGTEPALLGVMNLRGQIVPVIELGIRLQLPRVIVDSASRVVVIESEGEALGLLVSSVAEVVAISEGQIEHPGTLKVGAAISLHGVWRQSEAKITILLDANSLIG